MSALARDAAAFKQSLQRQDYSSWHSNPSNSNHSTQQAESSSDAAANSKKRKPKTSWVFDIVYSQPADTGTGVEVNTQVVYALDHLKQNGNPMRLQDLAIITNTPLDTNRALFERFRANDRVIHDPKTDLYSYRHDFNFRNKGALLTEIQRSTRKGNGLPVRQLRESWKEAPSAIEELEKEGEVFVTRTSKDQQMKYVFWNEIKPDEDSGGAAVEQEFQELWHKLVVPADADLLKSLAAGGLQATVGETVIPKGQMKKKGKKSAPRHRQTRLTNVHLKGSIDLSKDYSGPGGSK